MTIDPTTFECCVCYQQFADADEFNAAHYMHDGTCPRYRFVESVGTDDPDCNCGAPYAHWDCCTECQPTAHTLKSGAPCPRCGESMNADEDPFWVHPDDCSYVCGDVERGDYCGCILQLVHERCAKGLLTGGPTWWSNQVNFAIREGFFYPDPRELAVIPGLYETEDVPVSKKVIWLHYVLGACEWWIAEVDSYDMRAFGYACLGDPQTAEWGYVSLVELEQLSVRNGLWVSVVERDFDWSEKNADQCDLPCFT